MPESVIANVKKPESKKDSPVPKARKMYPPNFRINSPTDQILYLQKTIGNRAVQRLIKSGTLQAKLKIGQFGDKHEQEADRITEAVMRVPELMVRRQPKEEEEEEGTVQKRSMETVNAEITPTVESNLQRMRGGGQKLPKSVRVFFESRFNSDFSQVRVHADTGAASAAHLLNAQAFTHGQDIFFGTGRYEPDTMEGKKLLAHELTHVLQQNHSNLTPKIQARTVRQDYSTSAFETGPLWDVILIIRGAPEGDSEELQDFISGCRDGIISAIRRMGSSSGVESRQMRVSIRYRRPTFISDISQEAYRLALRSVRGEEEVPPALPSRTAERGRQAAVTPAESEVPQLGETREERLRRQALTTTRVLSRVVANADREGYARITLTIRHNGDELIPAFEKHEPRQTRPTGTIPLSPTTIAREHLQHQIEWVLMSGTGLYQIEFARNEQGGMAFRSYRQIEPISPRSEREEPEARGIPSRREIYAHIFEQSERELREAGIMLGGIAAQELFWWVIGGTILRGLGVGLSRMPLLRRVLEFRRFRELTRVVSGLDRREANEFARLMRRIHVGERLSTREARRLQQICSRIEGELARFVPTTMSRQQMSNFLLNTWRENSILQRVANAQRLTGQAQQRELIGILRQFELETGVGVQFVQPGTVQQLTSRGNFSSLRTSSGVLQIERQVLQNSQTLMQEIRHELSYYYAGRFGRSPSFGSFNALDLLDMMIQAGGRLPPPLVP